MSENEANLPVFTFFNEHEGQTIEAIASRIIPSDTSSPGAREAGVIVYIDRALGGYYRHLQTFYRQRMIEFDLYCKERHGRSFIELTEDQQDSILHEIDSSIQQATDGPHSLSKGIDNKSNTLAQFFAVVREHALEGTFCDPLYGGNQNAIGWKLIGFPGAQWGYTAEQMKRGFDAKQIRVLSLEDLNNKQQATASGVKP